MEDQKCGLCNRNLESNISKHHLIPKSLGGVETVRLHKICHQKIHTVFSERDLLKTYNTIELIKEHEEMKKFILWVSKKDISFYEPSRDTDSRHSKRSIKRNVHR